ncbi:hypothetical protein HK405_014094 [Cladochytrium tenue]|nr:hypothetical protein HK405_014094 [Cladochytrium tenue]
MHRRFAADGSNDIDGHFEGDSFGPLSLAATKPIASTPPHRAAAAHPATTTLTASPSAAARSSARPKRGPSPTGFLARHSSDMYVGDAPADVLLMGRTRADGGQVVSVDVHLRAESPSTMGANKGAAGIRRGLGSLKE